MVMVVLVAVGILELVSGAVMIDVCVRSLRQPDLAERLHPYHQGSLAEEAQDWLDGQS